MKGKRARICRMTSTPRHSLAVVIMVLMGSVLLGTLSSGTVDAAPVETTESISARVKNQEDLCEYGGGEFTTSYGYEDDVLTSAQVTCEGGDFDDQVCVNTPTTLECYIPLVRPTEPVTAPRPETADWVGNTGEAPSAVDGVVAPLGGKATRSSIMTLATNGSGPLSTATADCWTGCSA